MTEVLSFEEALDAKAVILHNDIMNFLIGHYKSNLREADELEERAERIRENARAIRVHASSQTILSPEGTNKFLYDTFGMSHPRYQISDAALTRSLDKTSWSAAIVNGTVHAANIAVK